MTRLGTRPVHIGGALLSVVLRLPHAILGEPGIPARVHPRAEAQVVGEAGDGRAADLGHRVPDRRRGLLNLLRLALLASLLAWIEGMQKEYLVAQLADWMNQIRTPVPTIDTTTLVMSSAVLATGAPKPGRGSTPPMPTRASSGCAG